MTHYDLPALNQSFGLPTLNFRSGPTGLALAEIDNPHGRASLVLQGAHLIDWTPRGAQPVLWLSPKAHFAAGKAIRGGVPICWPWFGAAADPALPAHGYARTTAWQVTASAERGDGATQIGLSLPQTAESLALWPHATPLRLCVTVGETLEIELVTGNLGAAAVRVGQALHAYFRVGDVRRIALHGLDGRPYWDKTDGGRKTQAGPVLFTAETDRIYLDAPGDCLIDDPVLNRRIRVQKRGSASTIVWNPWAQRAGELADIGADAWPGMVCVESANAAEDVVVIEPGGEHRLWASYGVETLEGQSSGLGGG
ncbi:MAG: D-hexose-6-phosphate mutarotase [Candidatus Methylumidiphilus sp.]